MIGDTQFWKNFENDLDDIVTEASDWNELPKETQLWFYMKHAIETEDWSIFLGEKIEIDLEFLGFFAVEKKEKISDKTIKEKFYFRILDKMKTDIYKELDEQYFDLFNDAFFVTRKKAGYVYQDSVEKTYHDIG